MLMWQWQINYVNQLRLSGTLHIFPTPSANLSSTGNSNSIFQRHSGNSNNNFISSSNNSFFSSSSAKNNTGASSNNLVRKRCLVTMHYYGDPIRLSELWSYRKDEVTVEQQHCGGNTLVVFRGRLAPGSECRHLWGWFVALLGFMYGFTTA